MTVAVVHYEFAAIGTHWKIDIYQTSELIDAAVLERDIRTRIDEFDRRYSRFRDDSLVATWAQTAGTYTLPDDAQPLLDLYRTFYYLTEGAVTPLIGQTLSAAGYDKDYTLQPGELVAPPDWDSSLDYDWPTLTLKQPALLDFGAAGKGYLVDIISRLLVDRGATTFCVDAGGDIRCQSATNTPTDIALEDPSDPTRAIGVASITSQALCGSAGNRRAWGVGDRQYHHIISPKTLQSPRHLAAVWVVAETGLLADMLTTALFFVPPQELLEQFEFAYALVYADTSLQYSDTFPGSFFAT